MRMRMKMNESNIPLFPYMLPPALAVDRTTHSQLTCQTTSLEPHIKFLTSSYFSSVTSSIDLASITAINRTCWFFNDVEEKK